MSGPVAVVVGLCAHGLSICRSLYNAGIQVVALETNRALPGVGTNSASVVYVDDINGPSLLVELARLAPELSSNGTPVLFLTNDTMVETIGKNFDAIEKSYKLSWSPCRSWMVPLLRKEAIQSMCNATNLRYPESVCVQNLEDFSLIESRLNFPVILKPDRPLSDYKTLVVRSADRLAAAWPLVKTSLPSVAQEYIDGGDENICFAALYFHKNELIARFEGRKLRSRPMGHTTLAVSESNDEVHQLAVQFFSQYEVSGTVSLELKKDENRDYWVIEPTVGRTDFWVGLCIEDGIDLPLVEYNAACDNNAGVGQQSDRVIWVNGERDPAAIIWLVLRDPAALLRRRVVGVYANLKDPIPAIRLLMSRIVHLPERVFRKLVKVIRPS